MRNQRGMISVDFIFAFVLVLGLSAILFSLSLTLSVAEVTQYVTFASARNYFSSHITPDQQVALAQAKYKQLLDNPVFTSLFSGHWFEVEKKARIGDITQLAVPEFRGGDRNLFIGSGTTFTARMLDFEIPFYGSTNPSGDGSGRGFNTFIGSYLGREISTTECLVFTTARWKNIRALPPSLGAAPYSSFTTDKGDYVYDDNGC